MKIKCKARDCGNNDKGDCRKIKVILVKVCGGTSPEICTNWFPKGHHLECGVWFKDYVGSGNNVSIA